MLITNHTFNNKNVHLAMAGCIIIIITSLIHLRYEYIIINDVRVYNMVYYITLPYYYHGKVNTTLCTTYIIIMGW